MARDALAKIAAELEAAGYAKGYKQAVRDLRKAMNDAFDALAAKQTVAPEPEPSKFASSNLGMVGGIMKVTNRRSRAGSDQQRVLDTIQQRPGLRGVDIAKALAPVPERTVRTALSRLKKNGLIIQQGAGEWFATGPGFQKELLQN